MSDTCPHGNSRGFCGNPACIPFNAGTEGDLSERSLEKFCQLLVDSGIQVVKGNKGGECNRTGCSVIGASWYNQFTQRWYCESCAKRINQASTHAICDRR